MRHLAIITCGALIALTLPSDAWAVVHWHAPEGCPTSEVVNARINTLTGAAAPGLSFSATATVSHEQTAAHAWKVRIETTLAEAKGERTFQGASCEAVTNATVVFITLMLAEHSRPPLAAPAPAPKRAALPAKVEAPEAPSVVIAQPALREEIVAVSAPPVALVPNKPLWHGRMKLGLADDEIAKKTFNLGVAAGLSWERLPALAIELGIGGAFPRSTQPFANQPWISITHQSFKTHVGPCLQRLGGRLLLRGCATAGVQMLRLLSDNVPQPSSGTYVAPTAGFTLLAGWRLNAAWVLVLNANFDRRLSQRSFVLQPWGAAWTPPRTMFDAGFGFEWRP